MTAAKGSSKEATKKLILQALTDPKFRKLLTTEPKKALGVRELSVQNKAEIRFILASVKAIEIHIGGLADMLLCANIGGGGGCAIATA